jgi:hypothetical protein
MNLVEQIRAWLGEQGVTFFRNLKESHGRVDAIWMEGSVPHIVHFREGMQVRNKLRELTNNEWTAHEYDDRWIGIVEQAIQS